MKLLLYISLIFLGFDGFGQEITSAGSKSENDTIKCIYLNGKVGLAYKDGRQILEPKYTDVEIEASGVRFFDGELQGYLPVGSKEVIPANYKEIIQMYSYFEARTENGTIDLYHGSKLIAGDLDVGPAEADFLPEMDLIIIRKEEKAGIIDQKGNNVLPLEYPSIEQVPSFVYILKDSILFNYVLVLDKGDYFYSPESEGYLRLGDPVLYLAKGDGTLISDAVFTEVSPVDPEKNEMSLKHNKKIAVLNDQFQITDSPFEWVNEFLEWKFCYTGEEYIIFNRFNRAVDTFADVMIPNKLSAIQNEDGAEMTYYNETLYADFVYVVKTFGEDPRTAIYDLRNEKVVSTWEKDITFVNKRITPSGVSVWIYKDETGKLAFSTSITGKGSAFEYQDIYPVANQFYAFKKEGESAYMLCELVRDSVFKPIIPIEKSFGSFNYIGMNTLSVPETDPELSRGYLDDFGNYYSYQVKEGAENPGVFSIPFTLFKNANGKLGFISWDGKVVDLNADTLLQFLGSSTLIDYRVGDLWGAAEIARGSYFKPDQTDWGRFRLLENTPLIYRLGDDEQHYVDSKDRDFYSTNPERSISKKGKYKGSVVYSEFDSDGMQTHVAIPFVYSEILPTWNNADFLAKGAAKKWGIISVFNDTVFPFQYDQLEFAKYDQPNGFFPYRDYDQQCLTTIGKFHGVLSLNLRKEIPAVYDWVKYIPEAAFIVKKNGKFGVYDYNLNEKIKPVFDELMIASSLSGVYILRAKKGDKWYNEEFFEGKVPDQTSLLQAIPCDFVINEQGYVKKETTYEIIDLMNGSSMTEKMALPELLLDSKQFKLKDGKIYLVDSKGKLLYPDGLTNIITQEDHVISVENGIRYSYSLLKKEKKIFAE